jgi:hypothetical protein
METEIVLVEEDSLFLAPEEIPFTIRFTETSNIERSTIAPTMISAIRIKVDQSCQAS